MKIKRIDHVGVIVNDLPAAKAFFLDFGLEVQGEGELEGEWLDQIVGLNDVKTAYVLLRMPEGQANLELIKFHTPSDEKEIQRHSANTLGIRHIAFAVEGIEAIVAKLKKKGMEIFSEIQNYEKLNQFSPFLDRYASNMPYFDFLDRLSRTACTEGLTGLSLR